MKPLHWIAGVVLLGLAAGVLAAEEAVDGKLKGELQQVARRQVFFGHQSVGDNVLEGLGELAKGQGIPLKIVAVESASGGGPEVFSHGRMERNGDPELKLRSFVRAFEAAPGPKPEIAFLKFCYVDIDERTDPVKLLANYRRTVDELKTRNPETTFVHSTVPLMTVNASLKAKVKRLLGRVPYDHLQNAKREEYNALLREAYRGREPLFDLAEVESTRPDGSRSTDSWDGKSVPVLAREYASDEGHLNREGRQRAARALVAVLARLPAAGARGQGD